MKITVAFYSPFGRGYSNHLFFLVSSSARYFVYFKHINRLDTTTPLHRLGRGLPRLLKDPFFLSTSPSSITPTSIPPCLYYTKRNWLSYRCIFYLRKKTLFISPMGHGLNGKFSALEGIASRLQQTHNVDYNLELPLGFPSFQPGDNIRS